jgi:hypothetical protein
MMASLRNLAIGALRLSGHASIAAALRPGTPLKRTARHLAGALPLAYRRALN